MNLIEAWRQVYNRKAPLAAEGDLAGGCGGGERISRLRLYFKRSGKMRRSEMGRCEKWRMTKLIMG
jgi:hypothetical protein